MTPDILDKIEQMHNDGHTSQEIVAALGGAPGGDHSWRVSGVVTFHDRGGPRANYCTRRQADLFRQGWAAAAKHAGLRKVVLADCGKDDRNCTECNQEQGDWHYMGCSKLEAPAKAKPTDSGWIAGPPVEPGHFWISQSVYVVLAFVYDGYPDDMQPPSSCRTSDESFTKWRAMTEDLGVFLRIRTMEGLRGLKDSELRSLQIDQHMSIPSPGAPDADGGAQ